MAYKEFRITFDTEEKAHAWGDSMLIQYHPAAYGTRISYHVNPDGSCVVTRWMADSAD